MSASKTMFRLTLLNKLDVVLSQDRKNRLLVTLEQHQNGGLATRVAVDCKSKSRSSGAYDRPAVNSSGGEGKMPE